MNNKETDSVRSPAESPSRHPQVSQRTRSLSLDSHNPSPGKLRILLEDTYDDLEES